MTAVSTQEINNALIVMIESLLYLIIIIVAGTFMSVSSASEANNECRYINLIIIIILILSSLRDHGNDIRRPRVHKFLQCLRQQLAQIVAESA